MVYSAKVDMATKEDSRYDTYELQSRDGSPAHGNGTVNDKVDMARMGKQQELRVRPNAWAISSSCCN